MSSLPWPANSPGGEFWGVYGTRPDWHDPARGLETASISKPAYDSQVWSNKPE